VGRRRRESGQVDGRVETEPAPSTAASVQGHESVQSCTDRPPPFSRRNVSADFIHCGRSLSFSPSVLLPSVLLPHLFSPNSPCIASSLTLALTPTLKSHSRQHSHSHSPVHARMLTHSLHTRMPIGLHPLQSRTLLLSLSLSPSHSLTLTLTLLLICTAHTYTGANAFCILIVLLITDRLSCVHPLASHTLALSRTRALAPFRFTQCHQHHHN
jgi:hypothetical protein